MKKLKISVALLIVFTSQSHAIDSNKIGLDENNYPALCGEKGNAWDLGSKSGFPYAEIRVKNGKVIKCKTKKQFKKYLVDKGEKKEVIELLINQYPIF